MSRPTAPSCSIFVGNVPYDAQEDELREIFGRVGEVTSVRIVCDKDTKQPKGYAFCDYADSSTVQTAIDKLNNVEYNGRKLRVDGAERELHSLAPVKARSGLDRPDDLVPFPEPPVATAADRLARIREREAAEQAAELAEIARLVETLTPKQVLHILGEMQRLTLRAPEVARALISENLQLCLALQHAQFLVGMVDKPPLPTDLEVQELARSIKETSGMANAAVEGQGDVAMPMATPQLGLAPGAGLMPFAGAAVGGILPAAGMTALQAPLGAVPFQGFAPGTVIDLTGATAAPAPAPDQRQVLLDQLQHLSAAEIDQLPQDTKVQLLEFLQTLPTA